MHKHVECSALCCANSFVLFFVSILKRFAIKNIIYLSICWGYFRRITFFFPYIMQAIFFLFLFRFSVPRKNRSQFKNKSLVSVMHLRILLFLVFFLCIALFFFSSLVWAYVLGAFDKYICLHACYGRQTKPTTFLCSSVH